MKLRDIGEIGLIRRIAKRTRVDSSVIKGIGDDSAVIRWTAHKYLLFTCDMLVEDVHFSMKNAAPRQIGRKALGRSISDIAAMGGIPRYALVSAALKPGMKLSFFDRLYKGMTELAGHFGVNIVGGDASTSDKLVIDVSLIGEVEKKNLVKRYGAKEGDAILLTGSIGGAGRGKHLNFIPRVEEARMLVKNFKINSMIDVSDSLALDLWRILDASRVGARIYQNLIPISSQAASFDKAISEGEDFELLFTMSAKEAGRFFRTYLKKMKTPVSLIGEVTPKKYGYRLITNDGRQKNLGQKGYLHF